MFSIYRKKYALVFSIAVIFLAISILFAAEFVKQKFIYYNVTEGISEINKIFLLVFVISLAIIIILSIFFVFISKKADKLAERIYEHDLKNEKKKQKDAELEDQNKDQLLANINHELKTPLNAIIGFSEIIMNEKAGPLDQEYKNFAAHIHSSGKNLLDMINNMLDFSKAKQGKMEIVIEDVDAVKLLANCLKSFEQKAKSLDIAVKSDLLENPVLIKADPKRLKQVLVNLLSNALKFSRKSGTITGECEISKDKKELIIRIKDTGIGIKASDIKKAFAPLEKAGERSSLKREGAGLGLPLAKILVEKMNGRLEIKSIPNAETVVSLYFPIS